MTDIGVPDTEDLASTDKSILVDIVRREMEAAGKNRQTMSDEELEKEVQAVAERVGTKISAKDFGPRFAVKRDPEQGITFEREKDFNLGQQVRGRPAPPDTFFENIPEAMAEAIGKLNQQNIDRDIDRSIEVKELPGNVDLLGQVESDVQKAGEQVRKTGVQPGPVQEVTEDSKILAKRFPPKMPSPTELTSRMETFREVQQEDKEKEQRTKEREELNNFKKSSRIKFLMKEEGFRSFAFKDGDRKSIGFGTPAREGDKSIGRTEGLKRLKQFIDTTVDPEIAKLEEELGRKFTQNQITALTSLLTNIGVGSTWLNSAARKALIEGDMETFYREAFGPESGFVKSQDKTVKGLQKRRQRELDIFNKS